MRNPVAIFLLGMGILLSFPPWTCAQWMHTGGPGGGWIIALAVSGENLFAGTVRGGVFLSTNNCASWTAVNSGLPEHASRRGYTNIQCLAVSGTNLFAGTFGASGDCTCRTHQLKNDAGCLLEALKFSSPAGSRIPNFWRNADLGIVEVEDAKKRLAGSKRRVGLQGPRFWNPSLFRFI